MGYKLGALKELNLMHINAVLCGNNNRMCSNVNDLKVIICVKKNHCYYVQSCKL